MSQNHDIRWRQRLQSFRKAYGQLSSAADLARERSLSELEQQGLIQAFEFTHELAWKTMKDFLEFHGVQNLYGSKDVTRKGYEKELIGNGDIWMEMITSRNQTSHTYNEATAAGIVRAILNDYRPAFERFLEHFTRLESKKS